MLHGTSQSRRAPRSRPAGVWAVAFGFLVVSFGLLACAREPEEHRPILGRLSDSPYQPYAAQTPAPPPPPSPNPNESVTRGSAIPCLEPDVQADLARVVFNAREVLTLGRLDDAVACYQSAVEKAPEDPKLLNDLAAAFLERAVQQNDFVLGDLFEAIEASSKSLALAPTNEARWNLAISLERIPLPRQANRAWSDYLENDPRSAWTAEAEEHKVALKERFPPSPWRAPFDGPFGPDRGPETQIPTDLAALRTLVDQDRSGARRWVERVSLPAWADAYLAGNEAAAEESFQEAERIANLLADLGGDVSAKAEVESLREHLGIKDLSTLSRHAQGLVALEAGKRRRRAEDHAAAQAQFAAAEAALRGAGSPFADWATFFGRVGRGGSTRDLSEKAGALGATARRFQAFLLGRTSYFQASRELYEVTSSEFEALGERAPDLVVRANIADLLAQSAQPASGVEELSIPLRGSPILADPMDQLSILAAASGVAEYAKLPRVAIEARSEALTMCRAVPDRRLCTIDVALPLVRLEMNLGLSGRALQRVQELRARAEAIGDLGGVSRTLADLDLLEGEANLDQRNPRRDQKRALRLLRSAVARFRALNPEAQNELMTAVSLEALSRAEERAGLEVQAERTLMSSIETFRRMDNDRSPSERDLGLPEALQRGFDRYIRSLLTRNENSADERALLLAEEALERAAPSFSNTPRRDASLANLLASIPNDSAVVEFLQTPEFDAVWVLRRNQLVRVNLKPLRQANLPDWRSLSQNPRAFREKTASLYQQIFRPLEAYLAGIRQVALVPGGLYSSIPLHALFDESRETRLDGRFEVVFSPSATWAIERRGTGSRGSSFAALAVGIESFLGLDLEALPGAPKEARVVASMFKNGTATGQEINPVNLFATLPRFDVIHFATHSATEQGGAWLALGGQRPTKVTLRELWNLLPRSLPRRPKVVLSACSSATGTQGLGGLARPFLAAGAREVYATLWDITDADLDQKIAFLYPRELHNLRQPDIEKTSRDRLPTSAAFVRFGALNASHNPRGGR